MFINLTKKIAHSHHRIRLTNWHRSELSWWIKIAPHLNGLSQHPFSSASRVVRVSTDALFSDFGASLCYSWLAGSRHKKQIPPENAAVINWIAQPLRDLELFNNNNYLEMVAAYFQLLLWAPVFRGCLVLVESDNISTVTFLKRGYCESPPALWWLKLIFCASHQFDFVVDGRHFSGKDNNFADALSRFSSNAFFGFTALAITNHRQSELKLMSSYSSRYPNSQSGVDAEPLAAVSLNSLFAAH